MALFEASMGLLDVAQLSQRARMLRLTTPLAQQLTAERLHLREGVNELFDMRVDCLASSSEIDVAALLGREISVTLLLADGGRRAWHGMVQATDALGADGGLARYRLHVRPWLADLALRRDSFIYQDKSCVEIIDEMLRDYPNAAHAFALQRDFAPRPIRTQYRESDLDFLLRLLAEEGLSFRFDHDQEDDEQDGETVAARHRLVIFDHESTPPEAGADPVRFHRSDATEVSDTVEAFSSLQRLQPNAIARAGWDDVALAAHASAERSNLAGGELPELEDYDYSGHGRYREGEQAEADARLRLLGHEARRLRMQGHGTVRAFAAGSSFTLSQHDRYAGSSDDDAAGQELGNNRYTLLSVVHEATNNLGAQATQVLSESGPDLEHGTYRNRFTCQPLTAAVLPDWRARPTAPEALIAMVTAADQQTLTTGRDLRVKVQFPWQRGRQPLKGGLPHGSAADEQGNAPGNETSGTWLRVLAAQAGPNWGAHHLPRKDTEVLVEFIDGDIDQPVVSAQVYNDRDLPPWTAGAGSDTNHPGALSGWHSHGLEGGHNQWLIDDTSGQMRMRLSTSAAETQLGLGYLVEQAPDAPSRGSWRGTGFELRSDAWAVLRSGKGLLLSAHGRAMAESTQADLGESLSVMRGAQDAISRTHDAAVQRQGPSFAAVESLEKMVVALDPAQQGKYEGSVNNQDAVKPQGQAPVERIDGARVVLASPNSINYASPATTVMHAGETLQTTTQGDLHVSAGKAFASASGRATRVFVQQGGVQAIAAKSEVTLQAHTGLAELLAGQDVTVQSTTDGIDIFARESVTLGAAGASVTLKGGDVFFKGPGLFSVRGASHNFSGPASDPAKLDALPDTRIKRYDQQVQALDEITGEPVAELPYKLSTASGDVHYGVTDAEGRTLRVATEQAEAIEVEWGVLPPEGTSA